MSEPSTLQNQLICLAASMLKTNTLAGAREGLDNLPLRNRRRDRGMSLSPCLERFPGLSRPSLVGQQQSIGPALCTPLRFASQQNSLAESRNAYFNNVFLNNELFTTAQEPCSWLITGACRTARSGLTRPSRKVSPPPP